MSTSPADLFPVPKFPSPMFPAQARGAHRTSQTLWIDGIGGYAMIESMITILGSNAGLSDLEEVSPREMLVTIMGDLPRQAIAVHKQSSEHVLQPLAPTKINGKNLRTAVVLSDGDQISTGNNIVIRYRKPHALIATARLEIVSRHRWTSGVDALLLLADSFVVGPGHDAHVQCPGWSKSLIFFKNTDRWAYRSRIDAALSPDGVVKLSDPETVINGRRLHSSDYSLTML